MNRLLSAFGALLVICVVTSGLVVPSKARADEMLRPYVLAARTTGDLATVVANIKDALKSHGFETVGEYAPYEKAYVIAITSPELKQAAARTDMGGFGAVQRVTATVVGNEVQVAYTNPRYMANVYRMQGDLSDVAQKLQEALGDEETFGARGRSADELRNYHYKMFMPYFDEPWKLGSFPNQRAAVKEVEANLAKGVDGTSEVYRVDLPKSEQTLIGVGLTKGCGADKFIMNTVNADAKLKSTPHLPYEILISKGEVMALHAKFRIAQSFPDLTMLGKGSFWDIKCAPDSIRDALRAVAGNQQPGEL